MLRQSIGGRVTIDGGKVRTDGQLDSVERSVEIESDGDLLHTVIRMSQSFPVTVDDLWDACTSSDRLSQWLGPVSGDLRAGGSYELEGNASGTIESCTRPEAFRISWEFEGYVSWVSAQMNPDAPDGSRLTLEHTADTSVEEWTDYGPGAGGVGWDLAFLGLSNHLIHGATVAPEATEWVESDDARQFIIESSRLWAEQSIKAGTSIAEARKAEKLTTAAFLGEAEEEETGP